MKHLHVHIDGSCKGNPGPGGVGIVFVEPDTNKILAEKCFGYELSTNNRMELLAAIHSLDLLVKRGKPIKVVKIFSDSTYLVFPLTKGWLTEWEKTNFRKKANSDLWIVFILLLKEVKELVETIEFHWEEGKVSAENLAADNLAKKATELKILKRDTGYEKRNE